MISRTPHKFDNLNWVVQVESEGEPFLNLQGEETFLFHFCTIPANPNYYPDVDSLSYVDQALSIDTIQTKFSSPPHKSALAPIPTTSFSISNLELWYHRLCEINGDDLNTFEGAKISIYMVNSLNPLVVWDSVQSQWFLMDGRTITQAPDPTILTPNYPTNEAGYLVFTGTIEDIEFSTESTQFNCLGISDRQNTKLGSLVDPLALKKDRGQIVPISFGDWSSEDDLLPVILDRNQNQVPKIIVGEEPIKRLDSIRLFDKVSERDFSVVNKFSIDPQNKIIVFTDDQPTAELGATNSAVGGYWNEGIETINLRNTLFPNVNDPNDPNKDNPATKQGLFQIEGEPVGFHAPSRPIDEIPASANQFGLKFFGGPSASRGWGNQNLSSMGPQSELFEIDQEYQKAIAIIDFSPKIVGCYWGGKNVFDPDVGTGLPYSGVGPNNGDFWRVINRTDINETDSAPDNLSFQGGSGSNALTAINDFFSLEFERIGFEGDILKTTFESSVWWAGGSETAGKNVGEGTFSIFVRNETADPLPNENSYFFAQIDTDVAGVVGVSWQYNIKGDNGTIPPFTDPSRFTLFDLIAPPSGAWGKVKMGGDLTTPDLTTIDQINSGRIGFQLELARAGAEFDSRLIVDFLKFNFQARVDAESGLWFARGLARTDQFDNLIEDPTEQLKNIFEKELLFDPNNFGEITTQRSNWKSAFSIYGEQKDWRSVLEKISGSYALASYQSKDGKENLIDYERRTPDFTISPEMVLLSGDLQAISYSFTDREEIFNEVLIKFRINPANNDTQAVLLINETEVQNTDSLSYLDSSKLLTLQEKLGKASKRLGFNNNEKKQLVFETEFLRDSNSAERLIESLILWNTSSKANVKVSGTYSDFFDVKIGDQLIFESGAFGGLPRKISESQFLVYGTTIVPALGEDGGSIDLDLIEIPTEEV